MAGACPRLFGFGVQGDAHQFRAIEQAQRKQAVAQAAADDEMAAVFFMNARGVLGEKALSRGEQPAQPGQANLTAVGMTGQRQIGIPGVKIKILRLMRQQHPKDARGKRIAERGQRRIG